MVAVPVEALSGVGPKAAARLKRLGLYTSEDLLRVERRRVADEIPGVSVSDVLGWQSVAELLEVEGIGLPLAEALHAKGVTTLDELAGRSLSALRTLVDEMRAGGVPMGAPSDDDLVGWIKDALLLRHTGTLNGTVVGPKGSPIRGVAVECMGRKATSDARGRFRVRRLPLARPLLVHLAHRNYVPQTIEAEHVARPNVLATDSFHLRRRKSSGATATIARSELDGDDLPPLGTAPVVERVQPRVPSKRDLLLVTELLPNGDLRVVSRLFDFDGATFIVRAYRLQAARIVGPVAVGDHLLFSDGRWRSAKLNSRDVVQYRRKLREQRSWRRLPKDPTATDVDRFLRDWSAARSVSHTRETS